MPCFVYSRKLSKCRITGISDRLPKATCETHVGCPWLEVDGGNAVLVQSCITSVNEINRKRGICHFGRFQGEGWIQVDLMISNDDLPLNRKGCICVLSEHVGSLRKDGTN